MNKLAGYLAPRVGYWYIRLVHATMRAQYDGRQMLERARAETGQYILAFWHSRFALMIYAYPDQRMSVVISRHSDARLLADILTRFGYDMAWGSSTRGGSSALREVLRRTRDGYGGGTTPTRDDAIRAKDPAGRIAAARLTGKAIMPLAFSARPARRLRSWDRTLLPYPFSKGLYLYGEPFLVPRDADAEEQERLRLELEAVLDRLTDEADTRMGMPVEDPRPPVRD